MQEEEKLPFPLLGATISADVPHQILGMEENILRFKLSQGIHYSNNDTWGHLHFENSGMSFMSSLGSSLSPDAQILGVARSVCQLKLGHQPSLFLQMCDLDIMS